MPPPPTATRYKIRYWCPAGDPVVVTGTKSGKNEFQNGGARVAASPRPGASLYNVVIAGLMALQGPHYDGKILAFAAFF
jgi:hypothetical protein